MKSTDMSNRVCGTDIYQTRLITVVDNAATGAQARKIRERKGISLREVGRRMKYSAPYISDLERGNRPWTMGLAFRFAAALEEGEGRCE